MLYFRDVGLVTVEDVVEECSFSPFSINKVEIRVLCDQNMFI